MEDTKDLTKYIYYRINSDINKNYYIIELQKDKDFKNISIVDIYQLLIDEGGFDESYISLITSIEYRFNEKDKLIPLKESINTENESKIYLELKMSQETSKPGNIDDETEYYQSNIEQLEKEIKKLSLDSSIKNKFNNKYSKQNELLREKKNKIRMYGINQNINFNQNDNPINNKLSEKNKDNIIEDGNVNNRINDEISIFYLYSYPIEKNRPEGSENEAGNRGLQVFAEKENPNEDNIKIEKQNQNFENEDKVNNENLNNDNKIKKEPKNFKYNNLYEGNIYYVQMFLIYEKIKESKRNANLIFEPFHDNFDYLEKSPDILHMKVNSFIKNDIGENKAYINLELKWKEFPRPFEEYINDLSGIKLFILSSQNIEFFEKTLEEIKYKKILLINSEEISEDQENSFISKLYKCLLEGNTIEDFFEKIKKEINKNDNNSKEGIIKIDNNDYGTIIELMNKENNKKELRKQSYNKDEKINLNKNCILNLDFIKYNYEEYKKYYKMMLNRDKELKKYIKHFIMNENKVCVFGDEGVGKKMFVQKVGYYLYERKILENVYYLELYSLDENSKNILKLKIEEIISINQRDKEGDGAEFNPQNILIIVYFKFIIKKSNIKLLEKIIGELNYTFFFIFAFTIKTDENEKVIRYPSIKLEKPYKSEQEKLIKKCINCEEENSLKIVGEMFKNNDKFSISDIYLRALYINLCEKYKKKMEIKNLTNEDILGKIISLDKIESEVSNQIINIKKILAYFSILKFGISSDTFEYLFTKKEISFIKEELNYIIFSEKNKNETIYCIDNAYIENIINLLLIKEHKEDLLDYLNGVLELYSSVFGFFIDNSNFPYDLCMKFNLELNNNFQSSQSYNGKNFSNLYFDDVLYSNNIISLFNYKEMRYEKMVAEKKEEKNSIDDWANNISNYIGQIAIYLGVILHFKNSFIYRDLILDFFLNEFYNERPKHNRQSQYERSTQYNKPTLYDKPSQDNKLPQYDKPTQYNKPTLYDKPSQDNKLPQYNNNQLQQKVKVKIIKYLTSEKPKFNFTSEEGNLDKNIEIELNLLKIYDYIVRKKTEDISDIFNKTKEIIYNMQKQKKENEKNSEQLERYKENDINTNINLSRLYILYGAYLNDSKYKYYLEEAKKFGEKANNNTYLECYAELKLIELDLINNEFNAYKRIKICKNKIEERINNNDKNLKNSNIKDKIIDILKLYDTLFDSHIKNKLYFFTSTPFYGQDKKPLKTESNNSFYLKYKLSLALPHLQFEFKKIDKNLDNLKKCLEYPIRFLYIGSDDFNDKGEICYVDEDYKSKFIDIDKFSEIINNSNSEILCDILILGIINLNNNKLTEALLKKFSHIIYFTNTLCESFKSSLYYLFLKKNFYNFIKEFLLYLSKARGCLTVKEAFRRANNNFEKVMKFVQIDTPQSDLILCLKSKAECDDYIYDFGEFNDENNNKNIYDEYDDEVMKKNNIYYRKNPFVDEQENEEDILYRKSHKFWKFPGKGYLRNEYFNKLVEKTIFSMKDLLRDIINIVKKHKYCNVHGKEFKGKTKICLEVCKHFFMNEEIFKKGIFVFELRFFNSVKDKIPELNNIMNSKKKINKKNQKENDKKNDIKDDNKNDIKNDIIDDNKNDKKNDIIDDNKNDILLLIEGADKFKEGLFEWLKELDVHALIISSNKLDEIYPISSCKNNNQNKIIIDIEYYNIDEKAKPFNDNNEFKEEYRMYKCFKY